VGDNSDIDRVIAHIAARQQRQVTRRQVLEAGWDDDAIRWRMKVGRLYREYPGVYSVGCRAVTPHERAMAAVLACGPGAVLSHGSALALWGIWERWDTPFEVTVTADRRPKRIKVHRAKLDRRDMTRWFGVPVTTLARTLLDKAPQMTLKSLTRAVNNGRQAGHVSLDALHAVTARYPHHRGTPRLKEFLGIATKRPTRSDLEDDFPSFCRRYGLPEPDMEATVCGYEVDALFARERLIVELDGWPFHSSRVAFEDDRRRDADTLAAGFATIRITRKRYDEERDAEAARLQEILARRMAA
jgi:hypothetical protein